jgi:hypothetical protein
MPVKQKIDRQVADFHHYANSEKTLAIHAEYIWLNDYLGGNQINPLFICLN